AGHIWSAEDSEDRQTLVEMLLHASDLSGPARPWHVASAWAERVEKEFKAQLEQEEARNLPISTFMQARRAIDALS
ncbi:MAG: hypothetical protein SGPRY_006076, partial [Prymnesium sp.]